MEKSFQKPKVGPI